MLQKMIYRTKTILLFIEQMAFFFPKRYFFSLSKWIFSSHNGAARQSERDIARALLSCNATAKYW